MAYLMQQVLNGVHMGALYALLAYGYALSHGLLRRANLAHGAIFALAGQMAILAAVFGWNVLWLALPTTLAFGIAVALGGAALVGDLVARRVLQPLAGTSPNAVVVASLGVAIGLMELGRLAMGNRDLWLPPVLATPVTFWRAGSFAVTLTVVQLLNVATVVALIAGANLVLTRSRFGRAWRAVCDDPLAAAMCGLDTQRIFRVAMLAAAMAAAIAGILAAIHFGNVSFDTGLIFGLKVLFVAALGYGRSPAEAAAGAAAVGLGESLWTGYFPADWRDAAVFAALVALLILRPTPETATSRP